MVSVGDEIDTKCCRLAIKESLNNVVKKRDKLSMLTLVKLSGVKKISSGFDASIPVPHLGKYCIR